MSLDVALLVGGWSAERQVSLDKGLAVEKALRALGYNVRVVDVKKDVTALVEALTPKPDVVFNNLYGTGGEDGVIQGVLEMLDVPYTHSNVCASAVAMDKPLAKALVKTVGVPSPAGALVSQARFLSDGSPIKPPYVIKPPQEGSSVGVFIVKDGDNRIFSGDSWCFGEEALIEEYIPGREVTVAVLDGKAQAVTEIVADSDFFDYEAKYQAQTTEYVLPANIPESVYSLALDYAERTYKIIGCSGLARCDFRYDDSLGDQGLFLLEINTQPGLTPESIGPSQVIYNGLPFNALCERLIQKALCQNGKHTKVKSLNVKSA